MDDNAFLYFAYLSGHNLNDHIVFGNALCGATWKILSSMFY